MLRNTHTHTAGPRALPLAWRRSSSRTSSLPHIYTRRPTSHARVLTEETGTHSLPELFAEFDALASETLPSLLPLLKPSAFPPERVT